MSGCSESDRRWASAICCFRGWRRFEHVILDGFEIAGVKVIRTRVTVLRVWLQLWDTVPATFSGSRPGGRHRERRGEHERLVPIDVTAEKCGGV